MKKIVMLLLIVSFVFVACNSKKEAEKKTEGEKKVETVKTSDETLSLQGTYEGTYPCADCSGIEVIVSLKAEGVFVKHQKYLEKEDGTFEAKGKYMFDTHSGVLTLEDEQGQKESYAVRDGSLFLKNAEDEISEEYKLMKK